MAEPMQVEVVSADRVVWSGKSSNIIAKTVEGEIGILPGHEPVLGSAGAERRGDLLRRGDADPGDRCGRRRVHFGLAGTSVDPERIRPDGRRGDRCRS